MTTHLEVDRTSGEVTTACGITWTTHPLAPPAALTCEVTDVTCWRCKRTNAALGAAVARTLQRRAP